MKKIFIIVLVGIYTLNSISAQITEKEADLKTVSKDTTDGWKKGGMFSLTFGQSSFTNWSAGGINNISMNGLSSLFAKYKKGNLTWDNNLDLGYGLQRIGKDSTAQTQKTDDKIDFASKLGLKATDKLYYAVLANFKTQFYEGVDYETGIKISDLLSPGYFLVAAGIDFRPNKDFSVFIAPLTSKTTFVMDQVLADAGAFGVEAGNNINSEFGGYLKAVYTKDILKNVNLNTKLGLFSNYLKNPQNIDVDWEVLLAMKINKYLTANINTQLLFDKDVSDEIQFKEILGIGFSVKF